MVRIDRSIQSIGVGPYTFNSVSTLVPYSAQNQLEVSQEKVENIESEVSYPKIEKTATPDDFVNMSYISSPFTGSMDLIVGQIPYDNLASSFWRMVWVQSVFLLVVFSGELNNKKKNTDYLPDLRGPKQFGEFTIEISGTPRSFN